MIIVLQTDPTIDRLQN